MQRCPSFCVWTCRQLTRKKIKRSERIASQGLSGVRRNDSHRVAGQKVLPRGEGHFLRRLGAVHGAAPRVSPSISRTLTRCSSTRACHLSIASDRSKTRCPGEFSRSVPFGICGERRGVAAFRRAPLSNSGHRPTLSNSRNAGTDARISAKTRQQLLCAVQYLAPHLLRRGLEPLLVFLSLLCCRVSGIPIESYEPHLRYFISFGGRKYVAYRPMQSAWNTCAVVEYLERPPC